MITWIRENAVLASVLGGLIAIISTVAVSRYQLSGLVADQPAIQGHIHDTTHHIDPMRDPALHRQWEERIEKLEAKIEQMERQQRWAERRQNGNHEWEGRRRDR